MSSLTLIQVRETTNDGAHPWMLSEKSWNQVHENNFMETDWLVMMMPTQSIPAYI